MIDSNKEEGFKDIQNSRMFPLFTDLLEEDWEERYKEMEDEKHEYKNDSQNNKEEIILESKDKNKKEVKTEIEVIEVYSDEEFYFEIGQPMHCGLTIINCSFMLCFVSFFTYSINN